MTKIFGLIAVLTATCLVFVGCSGLKDYELGIYTRSVKGTIGFDSEVNTREAFILVLNYHRTLMETSEGFLTRATASIVYPDETGEYTAFFDADTARLELMIYADTCKVESAEFRRTLGLGSYIHDKTMQRDDNWRNSFYLMVKPILIEYINDDRFQMNQQDRYYLGEWLTKVEDRL